LIDSIMLRPFIPIYCHETSTSSMPDSTTDSDGDDESWLTSTSERELTYHHVILHRESSMKIHNYYICINMYCCFMQIPGHIQRHCTVIVICFPPPPPQQQQQPKRQLGDPQRRELLQRPLQKARSPLPNGLNQQLQKRHLIQIKAPLQIFCVLTSLFCIYVCSVSAN
jgi:hypothetical protein